MYLHLKPQTPLISSSTTTTTTTITTMCFTRSVAFPIICDDLIPVPRKTQQYQYQPTIWDYSVVGSLGLRPKGEIDMDYEIKKRKKEVQVMMQNATTPLVQLELIDVIQKLGLSNLFEEEITKILEKIYEKRYTTNGYWVKDNLNSTALCFRLLRQHGFEVSQDVFCGLDYKNFGDCNKSLDEDVVRGVLSLYEASCIAYEEEKILEEVRIVTKKHLEDLIKEKKIEFTNLANQVSHSLEFPLHWRMKRAENRWFMDVYESEKEYNPCLLELAKLHFNMVQATHQKDLRSLSRWWKSLGIASELNFARDRLVETFLCSVGISSEPQYRHCREWVTKVTNFVVIIDDVYDIYGSLDELELFTEVVDRWDIKEANKLPNYMKTCFLALYNSTNEIALEIKDQGLDVDVLPCLTKFWANFIKAMMVEARWSSKGYIPSLNEYLRNAWVSSSGSLLLLHSFFATCNKSINADILKTLKSDYHHIFYYPSIILRLTNDLATSTAELERGGDVSSSIYCYMIERNCSEKDAREHIRGLILETWKKMNKLKYDYPLDNKFVDMGLNLARTSLFIYQYGDGVGTDNSITKSHVLSLIVNPAELDIYESC